jgi:hypothetical protein
LVQKLLVGNTETDRHDLISVLSFLESRLKRHDTLVLRKAGKWFGHDYMLAPSKCGSLGAKVINVHSYTMLWLADMDTDGNHVYWKSPVGSGLLIVFQI